MLRGTISKIRVTASTPGRVVWAGLAMLHAPALVGAWRTYVAGGFDAGQLGGCVWLSATMLFFALKLRGVAFLQFKTDRRAWVAIGLGAALVHVDLLPPEISAAVTPECGKMVATTLFLTSVAPVRRLLAAASVRVRTVDTRAPTAAPAGDTASFDSFRPHCWVLAHRLFLLRAPPV